MGHHRTYPKTSPADVRCQLKSCFHLGMSRTARARVDLYEAKAPAPHVFRKNIRLHKTHHFRSDHTDATQRFVLGLTGARVALPIPTRLALSALHIDATRSFTSRYLGNDYKIITLSCLRGRIRAHLLPDNRSVPAVARPPRF
jgi:hypothetical protein